MFLVLKAKRLNRDEKNLLRTSCGEFQLFFRPQTKRPRLSRRNGVSFSSIDIPLLKVVRKKTFYSAQKILCSNYLKVNNKFQKNSLRDDSGPIPWPVRRRIQLKAVSIQSQPYRPAGHCLWMEEDRKKGQLKTDF
jgi:hypothetical protein